jgi:hypothetical protein
MPDLQFQIDDELGADVWLKLQFISYMLYPSDNNLRRGFISQWGGRARDIWAEAPEEFDQSVIELLKDRDTKTYFDSFGGMGTASQLPDAKKLESEIDKAYYKWLTVGILFRLIIDFNKYYNENPSLNHIYHVYLQHPTLDLLRSHIRPSQDVLEKLWNDYRKVAHLCAAFSFLGIGNYTHCLKWKKSAYQPFSDEHRAICTAAFLGADASNGIKIAEKSCHIIKKINFPTLLLLTYEYQCFGMKYKPKQSRNNLIRDDAWLIHDNGDELKKHLFGIPPASFRKLYEKRE